MTVGGGWRRHPVLGRSAWSLADQAASSSSNFLLALAVLAAADRQEFAAFAVVVTGYLLVTELTRSAFLIPVLVLYSNEEDSVGRAGPPVAAGVVTAVVAGAVFLAAGSMLAEGRAMLLILAVTLPCLQYQDAVRHVAFAESSPRVAALADLAWLGGQVVVTGAAWATGRSTPTTLFLIWATAGSVSGLVFGWRLRLRPRFDECRRWLSVNGALCRRVSAEFVLNSGSYYALSYGLVVVAGAQELGRWRAAQALIGPVSVLLLAGTVLGVPESVRVRERADSLRRFGLLLSVALGGLAVAGGGAAYVVVSTIGRDWFPASLDAARPVLVPLTMFATAVGAAAGAVAGLRALDQAGWIVRCRAATGPLGLALGLVLATRWGAIGALGGLIVSESSFAAAAWARFRRRLWSTPVEPEAPEPAVPEPEAAGPAGPV